MANYNAPCNRQPWPYPKDDLFDLNLPIRAFENFQYNENLTFQQYDDLVAYKIQHSLPWKKPFISLLDDYHKKIEEGYEKQFHLPPGYLRGLCYKKNWITNFSETVQLISFEYNFKLAEHSLLTKLTTMIEIVLLDLKKEMKSTSDRHEFKFLAELREIRHFIKNQNPASASTKSTI